METLKEFLKQVETLKSEQKFPEAIEKLEKMITKINDNYRLYEELGDIYIFTGKFEKAEKAVDFALSINPDSPTGNYLKGFLMLGKKKLKQSIVYLEKSNKLLPNNAEVLRNLGWAYNLDKQTSKGIYVLKRALNISPKDKLIMEDLAMALIGADQAEEGNYLLSQIGKETIKHKN
ncbi:MAG: tetratricopeptide repeat protein [Candidatus Gracilibacteria bacterium]|nr:tetratricopeptide repeat protein [Candidatus Gracilibacteria bacterium]